MQQSHCHFLAQGLVAFVLSSSLTVVQFTLGPLGNNHCLQFHLVMCLFRIYLLYLLHRSRSIPRTYEPLFATKDGSGGGAVAVKFPGPNHHFLISTVKQKELQTVILAGQTESNMRNKKLSTTSNNTSATNHFPCKSMHIALSRPWVPNTTCGIRNFYSNTEPAGFAPIPPQLAVDLAKVHLGSDRVSARQ